MRVVRANGTSRSPVDSWPVSQTGPEHNFLPHWKSDGRLPLRSTSAVITRWLTPKQLSNNQWRCWKGYSAMFCFFLFVSFKRARVYTYQLSINVDLEIPNPQTNHAANAERKKERTRKTDGKNEEDRWKERGRQKERTRKKEGKNEEERRGRRKWDRRKTKVFR